MFYWWMGEGLGMLLRCVGMGVCAETGCSIICDYRCFGVFGSVVVGLGGYVLGILRVLRPLSP